VTGIQELKDFGNSELLQMVGVKGITPNPELCGFKKK